MVGIILWSVVFIGLCDYEVAYVLTYEFGVLGWRWGGFGGWFCFGVVLLFLKVCKFLQKLDPKLLNVCRALRKFGTTLIKVLFFPENIDPLLLKVCKLLGEFGPNFKNMGTFAKV